MAYREQETLDAVLDDVVDGLKGWVEGVYPGNFSEAARSHLSQSRIADQIRIIRDYVPDLDEKRILEVGSGFGGFLSIGHLAYNLDIYGIEPDPVAVKVCAKIADVHEITSSRLVQAVGERIPFADESFDVVYCNSVIEHVGSPLKVFNESLRVLKSGGFLQYSIPNYGSFWDGHFSSLWIPYAPKWLLKLFVKMKGRRTDYIDSLNLINPFTVRRMLASLDYPVEIPGLGVSEFNSRLAAINFEEHSGMQGTAIIVRMIQKFKLVKLFQYLAKAFHFYTPFVITLRKK